LGRGAADHSSKTNGFDVPLEEKKGEKKFFWSSFLPEKKMSSTPILWRGNIKEREMFKSKNVLVSFM